MTRHLAAALAALTLALPALVRANPAAGAKPPTVSPNPGLEKLKALAGEWAGTAVGPGADKGMPTKASIRVVSAGSAVMLVTDPGTPHEMVTLFHDDDGALLATHYCAAQNQPRMKAVSLADTSRLDFQFQDGTNLKSHPARMQSLLLTTSGPDQHVQLWTHLMGDQSSQMRFEMRRVAGK